MNLSVMLFQIWEKMITFTPHSRGLYSAMTFDTIWGSLMLLIFSSPSPQIISHKTLIQKFSLVYVSKHLSPMPSLELGTRTHHRQETETKQY
jgi:hypothetical protein